MNTIEESRRYPKGVLGASQLAAIWPKPCHPYITKADVFLSALGLSKPKLPSISMRRGNLMEDYLRKAFELKSKKRLISYEAPPLYRLKDYQFIGAHPDALTIDGSTVELKRVEENDGIWGEQPEELPQFHWLQIQQEMLVCGAKSGYYYCEVPRGGQGKAWLDIRCVEFKSEPKVQAAIVDVCKKAWSEIGNLHKLIQSGGKDKDLAMEQLAEMAKSDAEKVSHAAKILYPYAPRPITPAPTTMLSDLREFQTQKQYVKAAEENIEQLKAKLLIQMGKDGLQQVSFDGGKLAKAKDGSLRFTENKGE